MKKFISMSIFLLTTTALMMSCGSPNAEKTVENPTIEVKENEGNEETEKAENKGNTAETQTNNNANTNTKMKENMLAAFKGETSASAKYAAYSKKAEQEGYHEIALLFKATSTSENIHANNHKEVLEELGVKAPMITPEYEVKSTQENLEDALKGESYEIATMYPEFIAAAKATNSEFALISLEYAYKTEKKHKVLYETAIEALKNKTVKSLATVYFVCPTCGNTFAGIAPKRCEISMTSSEKFLKIVHI